MTDSRAIDDRICHLNHRLKAARLGLQIERRGQTLNLRGTLPPRPDSVRLKPHQQRLPLGFPATAAGLKQAEQEAKIVAAQLIQNTFDWRNYLHGVGWGRLDQLALPQQIQAFEQQFLPLRNGKLSPLPAKPPGKLPMPHICES